ncbi:MAG: hypothetical protein ACLQQ4_13860 [Bacteroidia bacterium]
MKKKLLNFSFAAIILTFNFQLLTFNSFGQSIPDGGFEAWNTTTWNDPQYYNTANDQNVPYGFAAGVTQTTGYLGVNYGVMIETVNTPSGPQGGFIIDANVHGNGGPKGGIPYSQKPTGIRFYYKYTPVNNDTAAVLVMFKKSGSLIDSFLVILPTAETNYTLHSYYPKNALPTTPDTVIFAAVSSIQILNNGGGTVGSTLVIDSVTFT